METLEKENKHYDRCLSELMNLLPKDQWDRVMNHDMCDIDGTFLGFVNVYKNLSELIPKHFTIIDFGCAFNPQCFFFKDHRRYVAVDNSGVEKFKSANCDIHHQSIDAFINEHGKQFDINETFAICSYVPASSTLIRKTFKNVFVYYPHGNPILKHLQNNGGKK